MTCSKVPPICHLKRLRPQSPIEAEAVNKWRTKDVGPFRQIGRGLLFIEAIPTVSCHRRDTRGWLDFHTAAFKSRRCPSAGRIWPSRNTVGSSQCCRYLSIICWQQGRVPFPALGIKGRVKRNRYGCGSPMVSIWKFPFKFWLYCIYVDAVNQTPGFDLDWKCIHGQMVSVGNREQTDMNVRVIRLSMRFLSENH